MLVSKKTKFVYKKIVEKWAEDETEFAKNVQIQLTSL